MQSGFQNVFRNTGTVTTSGHVGLAGSQLIQGISIPTWDDSFIHLIKTAHRSSNAQSQHVFVFFYWLGSIFRSDLAFEGVLGASKTSFLVYLLTWFTLTTTEIPFTVVHKKNPAGQAITWNTVRFVPMKIFALWCAHFTCRGSREKVWKAKGCTKLSKKGQQTAKTTQNNPQTNQTNSAKPCSLIVYYSKRFGFVTLRATARL